jgi:hypothetical protein
MFIVKCRFCYPISCWFTSAPEEQANNSVLLFHVSSSISQSKWFLIRLATYLCWFRYVYAFGFSGYVVLDVSLSSVTFLRADLGGRAGQWFKRRCTAQQGSANLPGNLVRSISYLISVLIAQFLGGRILSRLDHIGRICQQGIFALWSLPQILLLPGCYLVSCSFLRKD